MLAKSHGSKYNNTASRTEPIFSGNVFIFHAFDIGDDIKLDQIKNSDVIIQRPYTPPQYFKNYHIPLAVELPHPHTTSNCVSAKIHNFGAVSLTYKIPFNDTLEALRENLQEIDNKFKEHSITDAHKLFKEIEPSINKPNFFQTKLSYLVIQIDPHQDLDGATLKQRYGNIIASALRFEKTILSDYQKDQILEETLGYFKDDLIVIDTASAFVYDKEYEDILEFFEFGNIQQLELQYFDRLLDEKLNIVYEDKAKKTAFSTYLPFIEVFTESPMDELGKLKVDISVITERLVSSIKVVGEPYFSELYALIENKLDIKDWKETIDKKLNIIQDIRSAWHEKISATRQDILEVLIIILIFIELMVALLKH